MNRNELNWAATTLAAAMIGVHGADDKALATKAIDLALEIDQQIDQRITTMKAQHHALAATIAAQIAALQHDPRLASNQDAQPPDGEEAPGPRPPDSQEAPPATAGAALDPPSEDAEPSS